MEERRAKRESPGIILLRILACLLLAASLAMLFMPWVSLRLDRDGQRLSLREAAEMTQQQSGQNLQERVFSALPERDKALYTGLLGSLDPLLEDRMSPVNAAFGCASCAKWLRSCSAAVRQGSPPSPETEAWCAGVEETAAKLRLTAAFLFVLLALLLVTGIYALISAGSGYAFGTLPYLFCSASVFLGVVLARLKGNDWYRGASVPAGLLRSAVDGLSANPVSSPFRLRLWGILFALLTLVGILLAICALKPRSAARAPVTPRPAAPVTPRPAAPATPRPVSSPKPWRCEVCGTLMGDGVYCVKCGSRKPEPRRCAFCGALLEKSSLFCAECGKPASSQAAGASPASNPLIPDDDDL